MDSCAIFRSSGAGSGSSPWVRSGDASAYAVSQLMPLNHRASGWLSPIRSRRERAFRGPLSDSAGRVQPPSSPSLRIYLSSVGWLWAERPPGKRPAEVLRGLSRKIAARIGLSPVRGTCGRDPSKLHFGEQHQGRRSLAGMPGAAAGGQPPSTSSHGYQKP